MQGKYKILNTIGPEFAEKAMKITNLFGTSEYKSVPQKKLADEIANYDIAIVGLSNKFDRAVLENAKNLKIIATPTTGLDHIDLETAKARGIEVLSLRGETEFLNSITGTAELAFGLLLNLVRFISHSFDDVKHGRWDREAWRGHNLKGATLGVLGAGRLGRWMIRYGNAFGMKVIFFDPSVERVDGAEKVNFTELLQKSDAVSIHIHLSPETENMFSTAQFNAMKKEAVLINTARGKIVNEKDLLEALENKKIAGYAGDVLSDELLFKNNSFEKHPLVEYAKKNTNCIIVPHIGGMTHESREATDVFIAEKVKKFLEKGG
jgi:D-3-phosphoglycerate dehydrogenase